MPNKYLILGFGKLGMALKLTVPSTGKLLVLNSKSFDATKPTDIINTLNFFKPTHVFNTVAINGINNCINNSELSYRVNTLFPLKLIEYASTYNFCLVHFSTEGVFADSLCEYSESSKPNPQHYYGLTKYLADVSIGQSSEKHYMFRLPLMFGPSIKKNQFIEKMIYMALKGKELQISTDIFSNAAYSLDIARRVWTLLDAPSGLYHLAGASSVSLCNLVTCALTYLNLKTYIQKVKSDYFPSAEPKNLHLNLVSHKTSPLQSYRLGMQEYITTYF